MGGVEIGADAPVQITVLGEWEVTIDGGGAKLSENAVSVLHALVMSDGKALRDHLIRCLPKAKRQNPHAAIRGAMLELRSTLEVETSKGHGRWVQLNRQPRQMRVDLWDFLALHDEGRLKEAAAVNPRLEAPVTLPGGASHTQYWRETLKKVEAATSAVRPIVTADSRLMQSLRDSREDLLERPVSGSGKQIPIRDVYEKLVDLPFAWRWLQPESSRVNESPPSLYLSELLSKSTGLPLRLIVTGGSGMGKTLNAKLVHLRLTDATAVGVADEPRPVLYLDATHEASRPDFTTDVWLQRRLADFGAPNNRRAIVILVHADSLLSAAGSDLAEILGREMFRDHDILLCCSEQLYSRGLKQIDYASRAIRLEPWSGALQEAFAEVMFDRRTRLTFEKWRDSDVSDVREKICATPLHLSFLLPFIEAEADALERISDGWHVLDQVATVRLQRSRLTESERAERFADLAALAHRFYLAGERADRPVGFSRVDLRGALASRHSGDIDAVADELVDRTLLSSPGDASDEIHFEEASWGWFFAAWHLRQVLVQTDPAEPPLAAFSKFFSLEVMELCKEMLREAMPLHQRQIISALRQAIGSEPDSNIEPGARSIAREQIAYLLTILGDSSVHESVKPLIDSRSDAWEADPLVRRGLVIGMANRGDRVVADAYVEGLRAERGGTPPHPERDANIAFLLSFHRVQRLDSERPDRVVRDVDPSPAVAELVSGLEQSRHRGSWRIKLFTLADLGEHPAIEREAYRRAMALDRERLRRILRRLETEPGSDGWPEIAEVQAILAKQPD